MVATFIYSKKYGSQGAPISNPTSTEHFSISVPYGSEGKFNTRLCSMKLLADMQINFIRANGFNFQSNNGLTGAGIPTNPLKVETTWIDQNFVNSRYWPFSQVGDPTDTNLPISGSYFSVTYPYGNHIYPTTAFVEGNGDLRLLRHVTNGEDMRAVYCVWKNYRQTPISTMRITDNEYNLPGLADDEYIHNVHPMSSKAMVAEVWVGDTFKEFIFVNLNGTSVDKYHTFIRLGKTPLTTMTCLGNRTEISKLQILRSSGLLAANVGGVRYLLLVAPPNADGSVSVQVATVSEIGEITLVNNWKTTNSLRNVRSGTDMIEIATKAVSFDPDDLDRIFLAADPDINIRHITDVGGPSPAIRSTVQETADGKIAIFNYHYASIEYKNFASGSIKAQFTYLIDPANKTVAPEPTTGYDRIYIGAPNASLTGHRVSGPAITYMQTGDHYYARARCFMMLPSGDRLRLDVGSSTDVVPNIVLHRGKGSTLADALSDNNFTNINSDGSINLLAPAPTPVPSTRASIVLYDNLFTSMDVTIGSGLGKYASYSKFVGRPTAKTYKLLNANGIGSVELRGYNLSPTRGNLTAYSFALNAFRSKTGTLHYHEAGWGTGVAQTVKYVAAINADLTARGTYSCEPLVYTKMEQALDAAFATENIPPEWTHVHDRAWMIVPAHVAIAKDHLFFKVLVSFRIDDPSVTQGYRYSQTFMAMGKAKATIISNADGDCRLTDVDTTTMNLDISNMRPITSLAKILGRNPRTQGISAISYDDTSVRGIIVGGWGSAAAIGLSGTGNSNHDAWLPHGFIQPNTETVADLVLSPFGGNQANGKPTFHQTLGFGYTLTSAGMGALYTFNPLSLETLRPDATRETIVLGSARPAAGFSLTVTNPIEVYSQGRIYTIDVQTVDLTKLSTSSTAHLNTTFYMYALLHNGVGKLKISYTPLPEHTAQIFIGHIYTSSTEITAIVTTPVSRWEMARPSVKPIGSALPTATGVPQNFGVDTIWDKSTLDTNPPSEYLWNADDLYDTDTEFKTTVIDSYWSEDAAGNNRVSTSEFGEAKYFIVKTRGPATSLQLFINSTTLEQDLFTEGRVNEWVNIALHRQGENGFGSYLINTIDEDDMSFRKSKWVAFTVGSDRVSNTRYINDTGYAMMVSVTLRNTGELWVNGVFVARQSDDNHVQMCALVAPGDEYYCTGAISYWSEFRYQG